MKPKFECNNKLIANDMAYYGKWINRWWACITTFYLFQHYL